MGRAKLDDKRTHVLQLRLNSTEKANIDYISEKLNLSFREVFTLGIDTIMLSLGKLQEIENKQK
jgi:hypothetical protein